MANNVKSFIDKYKSMSSGRLSVYEILQKVGTTEYRNNIVKSYEAVGIDKVKIAGNEFTNYGQYSFIWEKSYMKSPDRTTNGVISNLNSSPTFLTPHLILDFSVMSIDDYRKIMLLHYGANEFTVECYDPIFNRKIKVKMYFATEEMAKLYTISQNRLKPNGEWEEWVDLVGVTEYKVELIGTNNDLDYVTVSYNYNAPLDNNGNPIYPNGVPVTDEHEEDVYMGEEIVVGGNSTFKNTPPLGYVFKHWELKNEDGTTLQVVTDGIVLTVNTDLVFYAVWETTEVRTLSFNYGMLEIDESAVLNVKVKQGNSIGFLPRLSYPLIKVDGEFYTPYYPVGWFKYPANQADMQVHDYDPYWTNRDTIIYAVYDTTIYNVFYITDIDTELPPQRVPYDAEVYQPTLKREGYKFGGWIDTKTGKDFGGRMPPYDVTLQAKWSKI